MMRSTEAISVLQNGPPSPSTSTSSLDSAEHYEVVTERKNAREISTWNLIVDTEKQMNKLDVENHYHKDNSRTIQHLVEGMELDFVALHLLTPEQLQQRTDLPPQVRTFFDRYQQFLATKQELDVLVASLKGRGLEYVTGFLSLFGLKGFTDKLVGHDKKD
ncbi:hypothetical protein WJX75_009800 [Coccomyxa subellipsoidea]|uniref:Uncharacterized protein n=1 Tax=Coccomyxa subellipsoidea TaxID=248742 RepID=A0ABR2YT83_9CHLO